MIGGSFMRGTDTQYALNDQRISRRTNDDESERKSRMTGPAEESDTTNERCPMCGEPVADSPYPRHRLVLEDESDADSDQHHERQVCPDCWDELRELLSSV